LPEELICSRWSSSRGMTARHARKVDEKARLRGLVRVELDSAQHHKRIFDRSKSAVITNDHG
jgi:hypothetical protein